MKVNKETLSFFAVVVAMALWLAFVGFFLMPWITCLKGECQSGVETSSITSQER